MASLCAGTDSPALVFKAFIHALQPVFAMHGLPPVEMKVALSSEIDTYKRGFLVKAHKLDPKQNILYGDVRKLGESSEADNHLIPLPDGCDGWQKTPIPKFNFMTAGFPCKDFSSKNINRKKNRFNIKKSAGKSGSTFEGIVQFHENHGEEVLVSFFENVVGLMTPPKVDCKQLD